jgi:hypothetical protein
MAGFTSGHLSTEELEAFFSAVCTACTVLQDLHIRHGRMCANCPRNQVDFDSQPAATARCFEHLPPTLTPLTPGRVDIDADAFSTVALPELQKLELRLCGPSAAAVAAGLVGTCPRLSEGGVTIKNEGTDPDF